MISDFPLPLHFPGSVPGSDHMLTLEFQSSPRDIPGETIFEFHFRWPVFFPGASIFPLLNYIMMMKVFYKPLRASNLLTKHQLNTLFINLRSNQYFDKI